MYEELMNILKDDLTETYGYSEEEAIALIKDKGGDFVSEMIEELWTAWSNSFPFPVKGED